MAPVTEYNLGKASKPQNPARPRLSCAQAAAPPLPSLSHSPDVTWQPISISSVVGEKKKKKNGSLHCDKRTFTANTAIRKSLSSNGLKCPKEACTCRVWVPAADRLTKQHKLHQQPTRDRFKNSIRQKEVAESHWWRGHEALQKAVFYITSI